MFKDSKGLIRNTIAYFIPFVVMSIVAVIFFQQTFLMLEKKNFSIIESQIQSVLEKIEDELSLSMEIAKEICVDSSLNTQNMEKYDLYTLRGIDKMQMYKARMSMCSDLFVYYQSEGIVSEKGTSSLQVFVREQLELNENGEDTFGQLIKATENFSSAILEKKDGTCYLLLLYYYPKSTHIEEKRIGFLVDAGEISGRVQDVLQELDCLAIMLWDKQIMSKINCISSNVASQDVEEIYTALLDGKELSGYTISDINTKYWNMRMLLGFNNRILRGELLKEGIKMASLGFLTFVCLSIFLWVYGKYRYQLLSEIKQFAISNYPELRDNGKADEYEIIRKVLEKDIEKLTRKEEDFQSFVKEARKQMTWLLLSSTPPYELEVEKLMESYGMPEGGPYYGVIDFFLTKDDFFQNEELTLDIPNVVMHYTTSFEKDILYIVCISLDGRDETHEKRKKIINSILKTILMQGYSCRKVACGLVYGNIREVHSSQQEAVALIQDVSLWKQGKEINFFDEKAHVTRRVPHIIVELLEQFKEYLLKQDIKNANAALDSLMAPPRDIAEDLVIYIRYKVISILLEVSSEKKISDKQIQNMMLFSNIESQGFTLEIKKVIEETFGQLVEKSPDVEQILAFIEEHYGNPEMSMKMITEYFKISERSVSRIMKRGTNKTYKEYLNDIRYKKACELLESTDWGINRVANEVGFYEVSGFYKAFKQMSNLTPDEYRNNKKQTGKLS